MYSIGLIVSLAIVFSPLSMDPESITHVNSSIISKVGGTSEVFLW